MKNCSTLLQPVQPVLLIFLLSRFLPILAFPLDCYLGIDVGTQGTKIVAYAPSPYADDTTNGKNGKVIARSSRSYGLLPTTVPGRAEQDPEIWMNAVQECLEEIGQQLLTISVVGNDEKQTQQQQQQQQQGEDAVSSTPVYNVAGIGVSGQQHGMVCLDEHLNVIRPAKLWCDVEAAEETRYIIDQAASGVRAISLTDGSRNDVDNFQKPLDVSCLTPGFTSPKILWLKRNEPESYAKTRWFVLPHDYVTLKLANLKIPVTDAGDASGNGLFDNGSGIGGGIPRTNSKILADIIDSDNNLLERLPQILEPNAIVGTLDDAFAQKLGEVAVSGGRKKHDIPVSLGSGDNMCAALGVGCVSPGKAVLSLGTSGTLFGVSDTPIPTNTPLAPFCDATGRHLPLACTMSCTGILTQVLKEWCGSNTGGWTHEEASREASNVPIGCYGITFIPYLAGERTPNIPSATGALLGLTQANLKYAQDPAVLYRACMEGVTMVLANALQLFPNKIDTLLVVGGGANNPLWREIIAGSLNCTLMFPLETESAALGAAFQAAAAATKTDIQEYILQQVTIPMQDDVVKPKNVDEYQKVLERFSKFEAALYSTP